MQWDVSYRGKKIATVEAESEVDAVVSVKYQRHPHVPLIINDWKARPAKDQENARG